MACYLVVWVCRYPRQVVEHKKGYCPLMGDTCYAGLALHRHCDESHSDGNPVCRVTPPKKASGTVRDTLKNGANPKA